MKPEWIKEQLNYQITSMTGLDTTISGTVHWQLLPSPGIEVDDIQVGDVLSAHNMHLDKVKLILKYKPLLKSSLVFNEVQVDGLQATWNLDKPLNKTRSTAQHKNVNTSPSDISKPYEHAFAIKQFKLENANIQLTNQSKIIKFTELNIFSENINLTGNQISFKSNSKLTVTQPGLKLNANIDFNGQTLLPQILNRSTNDAIQVQGQLNITSIAINDLFIDHLSSSLSFKNNQLMLDPLQFKAYEGKGSGHLSFQTDSGLMVINQTLNGVSTDKLMDALLKKRLMKGSLDLKFDASTKLNSQNLLSNTKIKGNALIHDGMLTFIDLDAFIDELTKSIDEAIQVDGSTKLVSILSNFDYQSNQSNKTTTFRKLSMSFDKKKTNSIDEKVFIETQSLELQSSGFIDLNDQTIHNAARLKFNTNSKKISEILKLFESGIPLTITGTLKNPKVYPNTQEISLTLSKFYIKKTFDKSVNKLKDEFNQLFNKSFNQ